MTLVQPRCCIVIINVKRETKGFWKKSHTREGARLDEQAEPAPRRRAKNRTANAPRRTGTTNEYETLRSHNSPTLCHMRTNEGAAVVKQQDKWRPASTLW